MNDNFEFEPEPGFDDNEAEVTVEPAGADARLELALRILRQAQEAIQNVVDLIDIGNTDEAKQALVEMISKKAETSGDLEKLKTDRIVEGVFNGECMFGSDGKSYTVPSNYASKSLLVEGDILKLTVRGDGSYLYKQIGPIERKRKVARLGWDAPGSCYVAIDGDDIYKVLTASVTFYKGQEGDKVVILIPKEQPSAWAAVENVVRE